MRPVIEDPVMQDLITRFSCFPGIGKVILFGSRATGEARQFSDIDLAVVGVQDDDEWARVRQIADEARTLLKIDLLRFETVDDAIRASILGEGKVIYERTAH